MRRVAGVIGAPRQCSTRWRSGVSESLRYLVRRLAPLVAVVVVLLARSAAAQQAVPVLLSYDAPAGCPSQTRFIQRLRMHTQRLVLSNAGDALQLEVRVRRVGRTYQGRLDVARVGQPIGSREFNDSECGEVVAALALSAALSIDPDASLSVTDSVSNEEDDATAAAAGDQTGAQTEEGVTGTERSNAAKPTTAAERQPGGPWAPVPEASASDQTYLWSLGPLFVTSFNFGPKAAVGLGLFASVRDLSPQFVFPLELALHVDYLSTRSTRGSDPLALDWFQAAVRYCPLRSGSALTLLLCSTVQGGWIVAQGRDLAESEQVTRSFFSAGLGLQGRVTVSETWELTAFGDITVPFVERRFAIDPGSVEVASSRPVGAMLGLGAHFGF